MTEKSYFIPQPQELKAAIKGTKDNDPQATQKLYDWFLPLVRSVAHTYSAYTALGEDAENIAWVIFYECVKEYSKNDYEHFPGYIKTALVTRMSNATQLKRYYNPHVENEELILMNLPAFPEDYWEQQINYLDLQIAVKGLNLRQQEVINLIYFLELDCVAGSMLLHKSADTLRYHHYKALKALRKYFKVIKKVHYTSLLKEEDCKLAEEKQEKEKEGKEESPL